MGEICDERSKRRCNGLSIPIIYVGNEFEKKQFFSNWFRNRAALKGSVGAELDERLQIVNNIYDLIKQTGNYSSINDYEEAAGMNRQLRYANWQICLFVQS